MFAVNFRSAVILAVIVVPNVEKYTVIHEEKKRKLLYSLLWRCARRALSLSRMLGLSWHTSKCLLFEVQLFRVRSQRCINKRTLLSIVFREWSKMKNKDSCILCLRIDHRTRGFFSIPTLDSKICSACSNITASRRMMCCVMCETISEGDAKKHGLTGGTFCPFCSAENRSIYKT